MKASRNRSFIKLVEAASRQVAEKVIERAKTSGTPLIVWVAGQVKEVDPYTWSKGKRGAVRK